MTINTEWQGSLIRSGVISSARNTDLLLLNLKSIRSLRRNLAATCNKLWQFTQQGSAPIPLLLIPSLLIYQVPLITADIPKEWLEIPPFLPDT